MLPNESLAVASAPGKSRNIFFAIAAVLVLAIAGFLFYRATVYKTGISEFQLTASVEDHYAAFCRCTREVSQNRPRS
jgi:hypothetical protein